MKPPSVISHGAITIAASTPMALPAMLVTTSTSEDVRVASALCSVSTPRLNVVHAISATTAAVPIDRRAVISASTARKPRGT
jgi:hypothetical protein